jgi:hypothetical protein
MSDHNYTHDAVVTDWQENADKHDDDNYWFLRSLKQKSLKKVDRIALELHQEAFSQQCGGLPRRVLPCRADEKAAGGVILLTIPPSHSSPVALCISLVAAAGSKRPPIQSRNSSCHAWSGSAIAATQSWWPRLNHPAATRFSAISKYFLSFTEGVQALM